MSKIPKDIKDLLFYIELQQNKPKQIKNFSKRGRRIMNTGKTGKQFILKCYLQLVFILI